ncbi:MAG: phospholipase D-like domain-containing protein [Methanimicrococcus sp.]|nr:phospholipase D-like domain-containing protein [Methanimicrococcus sp.]
MVDVLDTTNCSAALTNLIKNAKEEIILISPYLQLSPNLLNSLQDANLNRDVSILLIYRPNKGEKFNEQKDKLAKINVTLIPLENLHAKCYLNESMAVITSMNLYQHSQENNTELGIVVQKDDDPKVYKAIRKEALRICRIAQLTQSCSESKSISPITKESTRSSFSKSSKNTKNSSIIDKIVDAIFDSPAYCIRCHGEIKNDIAKPLCDVCYTSWAKYKNENFAEKHCFNCGRQAKTTFKKPLCNNCFRNDR